MRVLVTGGAGYIGSTMVRMLEENGHEVLVLDNLSRGHIEAIKRTAIEIVDLRNLEAVRGLCCSFRPEACIHFAGSGLVGESMVDPMRYLQGNICGGLNLLQGLEDVECNRFVLSSSCAVYGMPERVPIDEGCITSPISPYGLSKLTLERSLSELSRLKDMKFISLRYFNAAGADIKHELGEDHKPETHIIPNAVFAALGKKPKVTIFGVDYQTPDGTCIRDYVHVLDLCNAHLLAMNRLVSNGGSGIYNLGNGSGFSVREIIRSVERVAGKSVQIEEAERRPGDPPELVASHRKASAELGWEPVFKDLDPIVETAWQWHEAHPDGYAP